MLDSRNYPTPSATAQLPWGHETSSLLEQDDSYHRMFSPSALAVARDYLAEEGDMIDKCLRELSVYHFSHLVVIGGSTLWYLGHAIRYNMRYTLIEPSVRHLPWHSIQALEALSSKILVIPKAIEEIDRDELNSERLLFLFPFNVIKYLDFDRLVANRFFGNEDALVVAQWQPDLSEYDRRSRYLSLIQSNNTFCKEDGLPMSREKLLRGAGFEIRHEKGQSVQLSLLFGPSVHIGGPHDAIR